MKNALEMMKNGTLTTVVSFSLLGAPGYPSVICIESAPGFPNLAGIDPLMPSAHTSERVLDLLRNGKERHVTLPVILTKIAGGYAVDLPYWSVCSPAGDWEPCLVGIWYSINEDLDPEEMLRVLGLAPGERCTLGGGAAAEEVVERKG